MAYVTGVANSLADLLTALRNACTANGWTLSGDVLHKGTCYIEVLNIAKGAHVDFGFLEVTGGTGIDGSNLLTGRPADYAAGRRHCGIMGPMGNGVSETTYTDWDWPVTYHIHVLTNPDEVYLMVNYGGSQYWQQLAFGQSPAPGCPGTGNWFYASCNRRNPDTGTGGRVNGNARMVCNPGGDNASSFNGGLATGAGPFWWLNKDESGANQNSGGFHGCFDHLGAAAWSHAQFWHNNWTTTRTNVISASRIPQPLPQYSPNTWNNEAHLIRWQILQPYLENKSIVIGELKHLRFVRNDFLNDGQIITLGPDKWKVYPRYRKDVTARNGGGTGGATHSGTCAIAIRYDGP